jgi:hypothetical protein
MDCCKAGQDGKRAACCEGKHGEKGKAHAGHR